MMIATKVLGGQNYEETVNQICRMELQDCEEMSADFDQTQTIHACRE